MSISPVGLWAAFAIRGLQIPCTYGMLARLDAARGVQERAIRIAVELELKRRDGKVAKPTRKAKAT